jgi:hypothetical protein
VNLKIKFRLRKILPKMADVEAAISAHRRRPARSGKFFVSGEEKKQSDSKLSFKKFSQMEQRKLIP